MTADRNGEERQRAADADKRDRRADLREAAADEREARANMRDTEADERDAAAAMRDYESARESVGGERLDLAFEIEAEAAAQSHPANRADSARMRELSAADRAMADQDRSDARFDQASNSPTAAADAALRDLRAEARDVAADARDVAGNQRDVTSSQLDQDFADVTDTEIERRTTEREQASAERDFSVKDRESAASDRELSARDRRRATGERDQTSVDHQRHVSAIGERDSDVLWESRHDPLTGLPNRHQMDERLKQIADGEPNDSGVPAVLFCDVDFFKAINDRLGHQSGDAALQAVGQRILEAIDANDLVARIGGDEFLVVTAGPVDESQALALAEDIRTCVEAPLSVRGEDLSITLSIGVSLAKPGYDSAALLRAADSALHHAKNSGRNKSVINRSDTNSGFGET